MDCKMPRNILMPIVVAVVIAGLAGCGGSTSESAGTHCGEADSESCVEGLPFDEQVERDPCYDLTNQSAECYEQATEGTDDFSLGGEDTDCSILSGDEYDACYATNMANDTTCDASGGEVVCTDADGTEIRVP